MAKTEDEKLAERLAEIQELVAEKARIDARLKELTGISVKVSEKPKGFVLMDEIKKVIATAPGPLTAAEVSDAIAKDTGYDPTAKNVRSTGKYMASKDLLIYDKDAKTFSAKA